MFCIPLLPILTLPLSWSRSGKLLASGSDDKVVNIYSYLPELSSSQFALAVTIDTGHSANVFSVKFMPHSNDGTIITASRDSQVRIFDIERSAHSESSGLYLSPSSTAAKIFRSHTSSVKRIVTEASPFYFLTCSEDGDVRQWDIRQPESAYPRPRFHFQRPGASVDLADEAPPPLISYNDHNMELYSISCSSSQPHYIAVGGTHLHCFLHDRRMLGRNRLKERGGRPSPSAGSASFDDSLAEATQCVAKFAPYGQPKMGRNDTKQITACKLGDANPNELIVSWTGDNIYNFNILRDQQSSPSAAYSAVPEGSRGVRHGKKRKRYHDDSGSPSNLRSSRPRNSASPHETGATQALSFLMQLGNGDNLEVPISEHGNYDLLGSAQLNQDHDHADHGALYAQAIRTLKNSLGRSHYGHGTAARQEEMVKILLAAYEAFEKIEYYRSQRTYPVTYHGPTIDYELKLSSDRQKIWRFVQASGTLARVVLRFRQQPVSDPRAHGIDISLFDMVHPAPREARGPLERHEQFGYDFIKAILLWLDSGIGAVLREFSSDSDSASVSGPRRVPVSKDPGVDAIDSELIPYLEGLATDLPVVYSGHGGPGDDPRDTDTVFITEKAAVKAFGFAMRTPFADLTGDGGVANIPREGGSADAVVQNREIALKFWGYKVCMALLNNAGIDVNFPFVATAFGDLENRSRHRNRTLYFNPRSSGGYLFQYNVHAYSLC
jgi:DDB1- and CUL4-associated factor 6